MLARALKLDPALGRHGPRIVLLTIGGNFPIVGYHAVSKEFREHLRMLGHRAVDRLDRLPGPQGRDELLPVRSDHEPRHRRRRREGATRRSCRSASATSSGPSTTKKFRWQFFRVHFQFVMANELPNAYDFFMIVCGPVPLSARIAAPEAALDVATGDSGVRDRAWKSIEAATRRPPVPPI
jgi:hypothetical protein